MAQPTYLVTGATGKTGSAVVAELRARQQPVRAVVCARDARSAFERNRQYPTPPKPRLAIDDERWLIERDPEWTHLSAVQRLDLSAVDVESYARQSHRELVAR